MAALAAIVFYLLEFEDEDFPGAFVRKDGRLDDGAVESRRADLDLRSVFDEKRSSERELRADIAGDAIDREDIAFFDTELFAVQFNDRVPRFSLS